MSRETFERLRADLSTTFINLRAERVDGRVVGGLKRIAEFFDLEAATLYELSDTRTQLTATAWARDRADPLPSITRADDPDRWTILLERSGVLFASDHAALPEVESADELAHDEDVDVPLLRGAQVGVDVELGPKAEHALLGADLSGVELGVPDRAFEDGLRCLAGGERLLRERVARVPDRLRSERVLLELEIGGDPLESPKRLSNHLRPDPVSG